MDSEPDRTEIPAGLPLDPADPFRLLVESVADYAIYLLDPKGNVVTWNSGAEKIKGYRSEEILGQNFSRFYPPEVAATGHPEEVLRQAALTGRYVEEGWRVRKDGERFWAKVVLTALHDANGALQGFAKVTQDQTDKRQAEEYLRTTADALRTRLRQQEAVAQLGQLAIATPDLDALLHQALTKVAEILGDELCKVLELQDDGRTFLLRAGIGWPEGLVGQATISAGRESQAGYTLRSEQPVIVDDLRTETRFSGPPILQELGIVSGMSVVIRGRDRPYGVLGTHTTRRQAFSADDAHFLLAVANILAGAIERQRLEEQVRREGQFSTTMMETLPGMVVLCDEQHRFLKWNKVVERVSGFAAHEVARLSPLNLVAPEGREAVAAAIQEVFHKGESSVETPIQTSDGRQIPYFFTGVRLQTETGPQLLGIGVDVTEQKRLEQQLRQAQKMEAFGQLAAGVAHDFNNLLTVISGYSDILLSMFPAPDPKREAVKAISEAGERAASLTRQLLTFSRQTVLALQVLNLNDVVSEMGMMLRRMIGEDVLLTTVLDPNVHPIKVDPGHLGQVLMNLAVNARDAMPRGGKVTIQTSNVFLDENEAAHHLDVRPGEYVVLAFSDTGCGIPAEVKARIFEPFFTTKGAGRGTGLGLAVVHGIIKQSGGSIDVFSEPGRGTTFRLYFPAVKDAVATAGRATAEPVQRGSETILLVEDEDSVRGLAHLALETHGYHVLPASHGTEALRLAEQYGSQIALLATDVVMPGMDGVELARILRSRMPTLKVLYLSGYAPDTVVGQKRSQEEVAFLQKPYSPFALARKVRDLLDQRG